MISLFSSDLGGADKGSPRFVLISPFSSSWFHLVVLVGGNVPLCSEFSDLFRFVFRTNQGNGNPCLPTPFAKDASFYLQFQKDRKGAGVKGAGVANCRIFRSAVPSVVVWSILLVSLSGVKEKVMTIYGAGPLAAGPLCGLLTVEVFFTYGSSFLLTVGEP